MSIIVHLNESRDILTLMLNQPKANILTMQMMQELGEALATHQDDPHLKLVLLRGAGSHFSLGASVAEHQKEQAPAMLTAFHRLIRQVAAYPIPLAVWVDGQCLGGAFELVLCCHFIFATERARFACPEIKLGVFPPVLAAIGHLRLGSGVSERLILTGGHLTAREADQQGLITAILDDVDEWYETNLKPLSAYVLRQSVRCTRQASGLLTALDAPLAMIEKQYIETLLPSHDGNEGIAAFLEKRLPEWRNC